MTFSPLPVLVSLLAGAATVFAFAPFGGWPLQILALALLFLLAQRAPSPTAAFYIGWAFGTSSIATGTYWLYVSMHDYGGMPAPMAALAVLLLAAGLGLLYGMALGLARRIAAPLAPPMALILLMPACWMLADWTRNWIFTGFPWVATGYAHNLSPLAGYAPVVGVFGVGFLACVLAGGLAVMLQQRRLHRTALALLVAIPVAGLALSTHSWTAPHGQPISVRLLQGNVPQEMKFDAGQLEASLRLYRDMITERRADLIATPETAVPMLANRLPAGYLAQLESFARGQDSRLLVGLPWSTEPGVYFNSVLGLGGEAPYRYDKHHLVPFGEFIPTGFRWFVDMMQMPLGDFGRGDLRQPAFKVKDQWVLPNVCYEDIFGEEIAAQLAAASDRGAPVPSLLLNVSNIAWFGDTIALPQHLQASQMRSLELGRPMLRATNTGATAVVDERGRVVAQLAPFTRG
ncbi:MAG: apolipoprotein N-acyltransferase, partial [Burkholderiaceae bacterium]|nr:apolipoprotein N-acyltransferase [Burkholderiaceae bacterium]